MGLLDRFLGEFVDVIEWTDNSKDTMVYRFERYGNAIKYGAMLTVRESQVAVLVNEGHIADVYEPGLYQLETNNMPLLTALESWPMGFDSPFKAEVYFFNMRRFTDLKWGTKNPIMLRDKEFGAVRLRAFGTYTIRIKDPVLFSKEVVGTNGHFVTGEISEQLRNLIISRFSAVLGDSGVPVLDLAANYDDLSQFVTTLLAPEFLAYGLELNQLLVENISLPEAVEAALDKRTSMGMVGNLQDYLRFQLAESLQKTGGSAGASGMELGIGLALANDLNKNLQSPAMPPPLPQERVYYMALGGERAGPFDLPGLKQKIASNELLPTTLCWHQPLENWVAAQDIAELAPLFSLPPPLLP